MKQKLSIIKIGGNVIDDEPGLRSFLESFASLKGPRILIHGGGKIASETGKKMGIEPNMVDGRRITDLATLKLVTMVYGGLLSKSIVATLQSLGCNAIGLTGADCNIIEAVKRPVKEIDYGFVGDVTQVNTSPIINFLEQEIAPAFAALTHDGNGNMLNTNADTIATSLAVALSHHFDTNLIFCFEKKGVLENIDDDNSVIPQLDFDAYQKLKTAGKIVAGMIPKLDNSFHAIQSGVSLVKICSAADLQSWISNSRQIGTDLI